MVLIGTALDGDGIAPWLEQQPQRVGCIEVTAEGFFEYPSPYLAWLGAQVPLLLRATAFSVGTPSPPTSEQLESLAKWCQATNTRRLVHPLAFTTSGQVHLEAPSPFSLTPGSLETVATRMKAATEATGCSTLIEPIASPLRVAGTIAEADFLEELCQITNSRLLIDVTSLLVSAKNRGTTPEEWLRTIPPELIAAVRIGGSTYRAGRWHRDAQAEIDEPAWSLLHSILALETPDILLVDHGDPGRDREAAVRDLARLESALGARRATAPRQVARSQPANLPLVRPTRGTALFVLDQAGVFFSEARHELTLFNTSATLTWCLLEEGRSVSAITDAYRLALDLTEADARHQVASTLQEWFGMGFLAYPGVLDCGNVPLTTAIGYLLTNPGHRAAFRQSPHALARRLGIADSDTIAFVALDADELDAQAGELALAGDTQGGPLSVADAVRPARRTPTALARHYRLLSTTFAIATESAALGDVIREALVHLECLEPSPDIALALRQSTVDRWEVADQGSVLADQLSNDAIVPAVKQLVRQIALERHPFLLSVHAAVVSFGNGCVLLPASAGSGKTTLTAALVHAGATYFSDEIALLEGAQCLVKPVPLSLTVKDGAIDPLRSRYPQLESLTSHRREDHVRVRYLPPPVASLPPSDATERARWVVFPKYGSTIESALVPLDRPTALRRLLDQSSVNRQRLDKEAVEAIVKWMRGVECYDLPLSSLDEAVTLLRHMMER